MEVIKFDTKKSFSGNKDITTKNILINDIQLVNNLKSICIK